MIAFILLSISLLAFAGCGDAVSSGHNTALDSVDLVAMTDDMAANIAASPGIQAEIAEHGSLKIVVEPVINQMTGEILSAGASETFTSRVRVLLAKHDRVHYTWIMNRDYFHYLQSKELEPGTLGPNPETNNPDYALTATFSSLTHEDDARRSSYYLCAYSLTSLVDRRVLWSNKYEVKKTVSKGYLD